MRNDNRFRVLPVVRDMVTFSWGSLVDPQVWASLGGSFDAVFCRNVLMYMFREAAQRIVDFVGQALRPDGLLFVSHAESLRGLARTFHVRRERDTFFYERRLESEPPPYSWSPARVREAPDALPPAVAPGHDVSWVEAIRDASERVAAAARGRASLSPSATKPVPLLPVQSVRVRALELIGQERFEEALATLGAVSEEERHDKDLSLMMAVALVSHGRLDESEALCRDILEREQFEAGAWYLTALCREARGDPSGAMEADRFASYVDPEFAMALLHMGRLERRAGQPQTAARTLSRARRLLVDEQASRLILFGGGFSRATLLRLCEAELAACEARAGSTP